MRILVITNLYPPGFLGGYELGCAQMTEALRARGHEVRVVTSISAPAADDDARDVFRILELPPIYDPDRMRATSAELQSYFQSLASFVNPANLRALATAVDEFDPDVSYLWNILGLGSMGILALLRDRGIPWLWHLMDLIPRQICGFGVTGPQLGRELNSMFPGMYVGCSSHVVGEIAAGGVDLGEQVHVLPNWVHGTRPVPRSDYFTGGTLRIMSACGTLSEAKGTHILIQAAARLKQMGLSEFAMDLYGRIDDPAFRVMVHRYGVDDQVKLKGSRPHNELLRTYPDYDVFAFPTWDREPFGFAPLEAASMGCVPVVSDSCGYSEWMVDDVDCLKAPRDPNGFATRLAQVIRGELDLHAIGDRAQSVVWRDFEVGAISGRIEQLLLQAAARREGPRGRGLDVSALARFAEGLIQALLLESTEGEV